MCFGFFFFVSLYLLYLRLWRSSDGSGTTNQVQSPPSQLIWLETKFDNVFHLVKKFQRLTTTILTYYCDENSFVLHLMRESVAELKLNWCFTSCYFPFFSLTIIDIVNDVAVVVDNASVFYIDVVVVGAVIFISLNFKLFRLIGGVNTTIFQCDVNCRLHKSK